jgi:hypothetical protein
MIDRESPSLLPEPDGFWSRMRALEAQGVSRDRTFGIAKYETQIGLWVSHSEPHFVALIYGDFSPPAKELTFPELGITIFPEPVTNCPIRGAFTVLKAHVAVSAKTDASVRDASRRLNILLGILSLQELGNTKLSWWSYVTHLNSGGVMPSLELLETGEPTARLLALPMVPSRHVEKALYWVREAQTLLQQKVRSDVVRAYEHWWNAFECLVYAVQELVPVPKQSRSEKESQFATILATHDGMLTIQSVTEMFRVVDPGFVSVAERVFQVCFGAQSNHYTQEFFRRSDTNERLYAIRNAIKHGTISPDNPDDISRVEGRIHKLWLVVWRLMAFLLGTFHPLDVDAAAAIQEPIA